MIDKKNFGRQTLQQPELNAKLLWQIPTHMRNFRRRTISGITTALIDLENALVLL